MAEGLHDRLMESQSEAKKEIEKLTKVAEAPKYDESLKETIQLYMKVFKQVGTFYGRDNITSLRRAP